MTCTRYDFTISFEHKNRNVTMNFVHRVYETKRYFFSYVFTTLESKWFMAAIFYVKYITEKFTIIISGVNKNDKTHSLSCNSPLKNNWRNCSKWQLFRNYPKSTMLTFERKRFNLRMSADTDNNFIDNNKVLLLSKTALYLKFDKSYEFSRHGFPGDVSVVYNRHSNKDGRNV